jgi:hypothetical protein
MVARVTTGPHGAISSRVSSPRSTCVPLRALALRSAKRLWTTGRTTVFAIAAFSLEPMSAAAPGTTSVGPVACYKGSTTAGERDNPGAAASR